MIPRSTHIRKNHKKLNRDNDECEKRIAGNYVNQMFAGKVIIEYSRFTVWVSVPAKNRI